MITLFFERIHEKFNQNLSPVVGLQIKAEPDVYTIAGIRIVFDDDSRAWFRPSFYNPSTQANRARRIFRRRNPDFYHSSDFACFLQNLYVKAYPQASTGLLPTQARLGKYAYPPHNLDRGLNPEKYLAPARVQGFESIRVEYVSGDRQVTENYHWDLDQNACSGSQISS